MTAPLNTNAERAEHGLRMIYGENVSLSLDDPTTDELDDRLDNLTDALADLMHYARRYSVDFSRALERAERHHEAESVYSWEELSL